MYAFIKIFCSHTFTMILVIIMWQCKLAEFCSTCIYIFAYWEYFAHEDKDSGKKYCNPEVIMEKKILLLILNCCMWPQWILILDMISNKHIGKIGCSVYFIDGLSALCKLSVYVYVTLYAVCKKQFAVLVMRWCMLCANLQANTILLYNYKRLLCHRKSPKRKDYTRYGTSRDNLCTWCISTTIDHIVCWVIVCDNKLCINIVHVGASVLWEVKPSRHRHDSSSMRGISLTIFITERPSIKFKAQ